MDPFLLTHQVTDFLYDIGARLSPISIRDQMMRGYLVVTRALDQGRIGPDKPLLVVGAGAAGATAAIVAADNDVPTTVLDRAPAAFTKQLYCHTRFVCPTQYDWPAQHWSEGKFPWLQNQSLPLPYVANDASRIAALWDEELKRRSLDEDKLLTLRFNLELEDPQGLANLTNAQIEENKGFIDVNFKSSDGRPDPRNPYKYAAVVSCIGQGTDIRELHDYQGFSFWEDDPYSKPNWGLPEGLDPQVYISGAGDGSLQDFLRITTNAKSARELLLSLPGNLREEIVRAIQYIEDQSQRAFIWSTRALDHDVLEPLHNEYVTSVQGLLSNYWSEISNALDKSLRGFPDRLRITLAYSCSHFGSCYPLNRFLVLLVAKYMEEVQKVQILRPRTRTVLVKGVRRHTCKSDRFDCHDQLHEITFVRADCDTPESVILNEKEHHLLQEWPFNIVIIRHGIDWPSPLFGRGPAANGRHMLPYYLNW